MKAKQIRELNQLDGRLVELEAQVHDPRLSREERDHARYLWLEAAMKFNQLHGGHKREQETQSDN